MNAPITDPAEFEACRFVQDYYGRIGALAPKQFSVEEQHALTVLAAYVRARGEPVAWRWCYVYPGTGRRRWYLSSTPRVAQAATAELAGVEVEPLYL